MRYAVYLSILYSKYLLTLSTTGSNLITKATTVGYRAIQHLNYHQKHIENVIFVENPWNKVCWDILQGIFFYFKQNI
jgi:hypothetical protein